MSNTVRLCLVYTKSDYGARDRTYRKFLNKKHIRFNRRKNKKESNAQLVEHYSSLEQDNIQLLQDENDANMYDADWYDFNEVQNHGFESYVYERVWDDYDWRWYEHD